MSTGLKAPSSRGLARPAAPLKRSGLAKPGLTKTPSGLTKTPSGKSGSTSKSSSREAMGPAPVRSASRGVLKSSASSQSISGISRSGSSVSVNDMTPLKIGTRVVTKDTNLEGAVRFYGEPQFARGNWVGVELDTEQGKNDGEVKGVRYFQCRPNHGLFCKPEKLAKCKEPVMKPLRTPSQASLSKVDYEAKFGLRVGGKCIVNGAKEGTLLFVGLTEFAKGVWAGVALDTLEGKNDGSVKGERYFTCDPGYGLFSQATKIQMLDSPVTSSTSLASFDTPRKANNDSEDVMKPDFVNRTPASTPGIKSSLSGLLSKSRDIESMQKNIGDLQQKLNEVKSSPTRNGPSISATPTRMTHSTSDQYEHLKKLHEESEKERNDLAERVKASETEKLTYEARLAEVAEAADKEKSALHHNIEQLNKESVVLNSNNSAQIARLQEEIRKLETELAASLEQITDYEGTTLQNDNSAELAMNREQIAELQSELKSLRGTREGDQNKVARLESELTDAIQLSETLQIELETINTSQEGVSGLLSAAQNRISTLEQQLADANNSLADFKSSIATSHCVLAAERETSAKLGEDLTSAQQQSSELHSEILSMRSAHEAYVQSSDKKLTDLEDKLHEREQALSDLKSELSALSTSSSSDKIHLEQKLQDSLSNLARLEGQTGRDAARITDLQNLVSAASDGNTQLVTAHKNISELEKTLREHDTASNEELAAVHGTVTELRVELNRAKQRASEDLETANTRCRDLQVSLEKVQMERSMEQTQTEKDIGELQLQLAETDKLRADNSRLNNNINTLRTEVATLQSTSNELDDSNRAVTSLKKQLESERTEQANLVASLENNIDEVETRLATVNNDKAAGVELSTKQGVRISVLEKEAAGLREKLGEVETRAAERIAKLETQLEEIELQAHDKAAEIAELREEVATCKEQLKDSELQLRDLAEECDTKQSDEEIENLHKQISNLSEENDVLKLSFEEKNAEFEDLTREVSNLREISETAFTELEKNDLQFTTSVKKLKTTEFQLDDALFKMKELQTKINDLEEEVVREKSRARELEQRLNTPPLMSFENLDNLSNISSSPPITAPNFIPDRIFCDNCDVFDDHDTEHCRLELEYSDDVERGDEASTSPGGVRHGGHRGLSGRPYCTVCEMFGHIAEECEDDMTF